MKLGGRVPGEFEVVFVVDGSPDRCLEILRERLPALPLRTQLLSLSRNFGMLRRHRGRLGAARAASASRSWPRTFRSRPSSSLQFFEALGSGRADIVFGVRGGRSDPWHSEMASTVFWFLYRKFVIKDMPPGGVDVFGCTREVRDHLLQLQGIDTNMVALLFWLGYRREYIVYERQRRLEGKSAWTLGKKLRYALDSIFNFTDLPIRILLYSGAVALLLAIVVSALVVFAKLRGDIPVPGYTPIVLAHHVLRRADSLGFGIVGQYLWLGLQIGRRRPNYIVRSAEEHGPK